MRLIQKIFCWPTSETRRSSEMQIDPAKNYFYFFNWKQSQSQLNAFKFDFKHKSFINASQNNTLQAWASDANQIKNHF